MFWKNLKSIIIVFIKKLVFVLFFSFPKYPYDFLSNGSSVNFMLDIKL